MLFDSKSLGRLRRLSLVAKRAGCGLLARPRVRLPAGGTDLTGHRDYAPGDDYRHVDWNLCARHDELRVKRFEGEAECPVYVLVDCSRSMSLGRLSKLEVARQAAAALAYLALAESERVTVLGFSDRIVARFGPIGNKAKVFKLGRFLEALEPQSEPTDLAAAARDFVASRPRRGVTVVISDLCDRRGFERGLDVFRRGGYPPRVVHLCDPREREPESLGDTELVDVETGASWQVTLTERRAAQYRRLYAEFRDSVRTYCAGHGMACAQVAVDSPEDSLLPRVLGIRR